MKVIGDKILVRVLDEEKTSRAGLIVPKDSSDESRRAEVIEVGDGTNDTKMVVNKGDNIIIGKFVGTKVEVSDDGEEYKVISQKDVLVIL